jgi:hypothetical protein
MSYKIPFLVKWSAILRFADSPIPLAVSRPASEWVRNIDDDVGEDEKIKRPSSPDADIGYSICQSKMEQVQ